MRKHFPHIYSTLARDRSIIPALLLSHLVKYIISVLLILLNNSASVPHFKRVIGLYVWGESSEGTALCLESVQIPRRPQDSILQRLRNCLGETERQP